MDRLHRLEVFIRVAERASFSAAGRELGLGQPQVSRAVGDLEREVGARLFIRSTRRVTLTAEGERYLVASRAALETLEEAAEDLRAGAGVVRGKLRVTAPLELADRIAPIFAELLERHPGLTIEAIQTDRIVDLIGEGFDVALRVGPLAPSTLRSRVLGVTETVLCAAPAYLRERGAPRRPTDLRRHAHVLLGGKSGVADRLALFDRQGRGVQVQIGGRLRTNELRVARAATLAGAGIAVLPRTVVSGALEEGRLTQVLPGWVGRPIKIHAVFAPRSPQPARVTELLDRLATVFRRKNR